LIEDGGALILFASAAVAEKQHPTDRSVIFLNSHRSKRKTYGLAPVAHKDPIYRYPLILSQILAR